jgi:hypothetical protein
MVTGLRLAVMASEAITYFRFSQEKMNHAWILELHAQLWKTMPAPDEARSSALQNRTGFREARISTGRSELREICVAEQNCREL